MTGSMELVAICCSAIFLQRFEFAPIYRKAQPAPIFAEPRVHTMGGANHPTRAAKQPPKKPRLPDGSLFS